MKEIKVKATFNEEVLGSLPADPEVYRQFIASKAPDAKTLEEEVAEFGADDVVDNKITVFLRDAEGHPQIYDYQVRGFLKEAIGFLKKVSGTECSKMTNYKKTVDGLIFVKERMIPVMLDGRPVERADMGTCERPLRAQTAQGERIALAISETCPAGSYIEFTIQMFRDGDEKAVREALDYGAFHGFLQWRNSGKGKFAWEEIA